MTGPGEWRFGSDVAISIQGVVPNQSHGFRRLAARADTRRRLGGHHPVERNHHGHPLVECQHAVSFGDAGLFCAIIASR